MNTPSKAGRTKRSKAVKQLTPDELFFYDNAGYCYDPKMQTPEQGRIECAKSLALAEQQARNLDWSYCWSDDWDIGSHVKEFGKESYSEEPGTCESCQLWDADAIHCLASLGCIDDATPEYRRVIEAELAAEALHDYDREIEILDAH